MGLRNTSDRYGAVAILFHWVVAALMIVAFIIAQIAEDLPREERAGVMANHFSVGLIVLGLALLRVLWRAGNPPPHELPAPPMQALAARIVHIGLYAVMLILPITGWLSVAASERNIPVAIFGIPFFDPWGPGGSESLHEITGEIHEVLGKVLLLLFVLHVAGALKHHFMDKDSTLTRMLGYVRK